jgi:hypothetical protein
MPITVYLKHLSPVKIKDLTLVAANETDIPYLGYIEHDQELWGCKFHYLGLIDYLFTPRLRIFHVHGDVIIAGEGLNNLGLSSALRAFEQGGIFIVQNIRPRFFRSHPKDSPIQSPLTTRVHLRGFCVCAELMYTMTWTKKMKNAKNQTTIIQNKICFLGFSEWKPFYGILLFLPELYRVELYIKLPDAALSIFIC